MTGHGRLGGWAVALGAAMVGTGCTAGGDSCPGTGGDRVREPLVDAFAWESEDATGDPFPEHRPRTLMCLPTGAYPEGTGFEIDTDDCNYAAFVQPSLQPVAAGDKIAVTVVHEDLTAPDPTEAHVAVLLGTQVLWDESIPIPKVATPYEIEVDVSDCIPAGTPVHLHVHNHGVNSYRLVAVDVIPGD